MSKKKPFTPYEEAMRNINRIIAELGVQLKGARYDQMGRKNE